VHDVAPADGSNIETNADPNIAAAFANLCTLMYGSVMYIDRITPLLLLHAGNPGRFRVRLQNFLAISVDGAAGGVSCCGHA
jgi:hypothetical protein